MSRESDLAAKMKKKGGRITTLSYGTVSAVNDSSDGVTLDVDVDDGTLAGVPMTASCAGVSVGDRVVVERCGRLSIVTGVIARDNSHSVNGKVFIGTTVLQSSSLGGQILFSSPGNFVDNFGREFDITRDFVIMYNGDGNTVPYCAISPEVRWKDNVQEIVARTSKSIGEGQLFRVNWLVYLGE